VSHWDNRSGGDELDTSRCYMGRSRFASLAAMLPQPTTILGIDEHTGLVLDPEKGCADVLGRGGVTVLRDEKELRFGSRQRLPLTALGPFHLPEESIALPPEIPPLPEAAGRTAGALPSQVVLALLAEREKARSTPDWAEADRLRGKILELGWSIQDTADGPRLAPA
jgi:hypothetical protein